MAVVPVAITDETPLAFRWEVTGQEQQLRSPIPLGLIVFAGTDAIPALVAGDETNYSLVLTMPGGAVYLPRNLMQRARADALDNKWDNNGSGDYSRPSLRTPIGTGGATRTFFNMTSPGEINASAISGQRIWVPGSGTPKLLLGPGDTLTFNFIDMAGDSDAGDMDYYHEFYIFNLDQVDKWEINTPIPVISHVSF